MTFLACAGRRSTLALLAVALLSVRTRAQDPTPGADLPTDGSTPFHTVGSRLIAMPILRSAPATGMGGGLGVAYRFPADSGVRASAVGAGGVYTSNSSWAYGAGGRAYLAHDLSRNLAGAADYRLRYPFFGVGTAAGDAGHSVRVLQRGDAEVAEATVRALPNLYVGARYRRAHFSVGLDESDPDPALPPLVARDHLYLTSAPGVMALYDTRDDEVATTRGTWMRGDAMFARASLGGLQSFNDFDLAAEHFLPLSARSVLAVRASVCDVTNGAPVWELCQLGLGPDLRGYTAGRYRDNTLSAAQAEYRFPVWRRFGGVAFAGVAAVAPALDQLAWKNVLGDGGAGARFLVLPSLHLNAGVDYALGKNGGAFYFRLGEAF